MVFLVFAGWPLFLKSKLSQKMKNLKYPKIYLTLFFPPKNLKFHCHILVILCTVSHNIYVKCLEISI